MSIFGTRFSDMIMSMAGVEEDSDSDLSTHSTSQAMASSSLQRENPFLKKKHNKSGENSVGQGINRVSSFEGNSFL